MRAVQALVMGRRALVLASHPPPGPPSQRGSRGHRFPGLPASRDCWKAAPGKPPAKPRLITLPAAGDHQALAISGHHPCFGCGRGARALGCSALPLSCRAGPCLWLHCTALKTSACVYEFSSSPRSPASCTPARQLWEKKKSFCSPRTLGSGENMPPASSVLPGRGLLDHPVSRQPSSPYPTRLPVPASPSLTKQCGGAARAGSHKAGSGRLGGSSRAPALASPAWFYDDSSSPKADGISCALLLVQMQSHGGEGKEQRAGTATTPLQRSQCS